MHVWTHRRTHLALPSGLVVLTASIASTAILAKKSLSAPMIFEDMAVLAQLISASLPSVSTLMARCSSMNLQACAGVHREGCLRHCPVQQGKADRAAQRLIHSVCLISQQ